METKSETRMYFINRTTKKIGTFYAIGTKRTSIDGSTDIVEVTFEAKGSKKDKVDYYFNEQEWLEDIKTF